MSHNYPDALVLLRYWVEVFTDLDHAVDLLYALSPRHMRNINKQLLKQFTSRRRTDARKDASYVLQQLELGRSVISGLVLDLRIDLSVLRE